MMNYFGWGEGMWFINMPFGIAPFFILLMAWSLVWKGLALWHSGRRGEPVWFIVLLLVNTLGILEIIYLFGVAKLLPSQLFSKFDHRAHHAHHEHHA